jgi:hypothetical protein
VKVVVEFGAGPDGVMRGTVVTAYPILAVESEGATAMVDVERATLIRRAAEAIRRPGDVAFSYDADSDTMLIFFLGEPVPATSVPVDDPNDVLYVL